MKELLRLFVVWAAVISVIALTYALLQITGTIQTIPPIFVGDFLLAVFGCGFVESLREPKKGEINVN